MISTAAGGLPPGTPGPGTAASIGDPPRIAVDSSGNVYFGSLHAIFAVDPKGIMTRVAGTGRAGYSGDGGTAAGAQMQYPEGIAVDSTGSIYVADRVAQVIRKITRAGISTYAGTGTAGFAGDNGPAAQALLNQPSGLSVDAAGNLYIADTGNNCIRSISSSGTITTFAGNSGFGPAFGGDGGQATAAMLNGPAGVAADGAGNVFIADTFNSRVRKVAADGTITTIIQAGDGEVPSLFLPSDVAVDSSGTVYVADFASSMIYAWSNGTLRTVAGSTNGTPLSSGQAAISVVLTGPTGVAVDTNNNVYFAEGSIGSGSGLAGGDFRVWVVTAAGELLALAGNGWRSFSGDGGPATLAQIDTPGGITFDSKGNLYIADSANHRIRKIATDGTISTVAGTGVAGFSGDGGPAVNAQLNSPSGVAVDSLGQIYIADTLNQRIREVLRDGTIGTYAGNGNAAFYGDGLRSLQASLHNPAAVAVDASMNLFIADTLNYRVREVQADGTTRTVAGTGSQGSGGDGGDGAKAQLNLPMGVAVDTGGNVYIADFGAGNVRQVNAAGVISTVSGGINPRGVAVDSAGRLFVADAGANQASQIVSGAATVVAGNGTCCYSGDGGPAVLAQLNQPWGIAPDAAGDVYIADTGNNAIRVLQPGAGAPVISRVANGASNLSGPIAPGEIVVIYGSLLGPANLVQNQAVQGALGAQVAGVSVRFNGMAGPILYASAGQVSAIVPYGVSGSPVQVVVQYQDKSSSPATVALAAAAPGLFTAIPTGSGQAAAYNQDTSANSQGNPAHAGTLITLYATGEGQTSPAGVDGKLAGVPAPQPLLRVTAMIGNQPAIVQYAGGAPTAPAGLMQVNLYVPRGLTPGPVPVVVSVGGIPSQDGVTVVVAN